MAEELHQTHPYVESLGRSSKYSPRAVQEFRIRAVVLDGAWREFSGNACGGADAESPSSDPSGAGSGTAALRASGTHQQGGEQALAADSWAQGGSQPRAAQTSDSICSTQSLP